MVSVGKKVCMATTRVPRSATATARDGVDTRKQENSKAPAGAEGETTRLGAGDQGQDGSNAAGGGDTFAAFLERAFDEARDANDRELLLAVETRDKDLLVKIENFRREKLTERERADNSCEDILRRIPNDAILRGVFRKDTTRQTIHEKVQIEWIRRNQYGDARKMSADRNGVCLSNGKLHTITAGAPRPKDGATTKTFDVEVPSMKMFGILKHTSAPGGAQDNQFRDVKGFVSEGVRYFVENPSAEETFVFYLDGKYYTAKKNEELRAMIPESMKTKIVITCCESIVSKTGE